MRAFASAHNHPVYEQHILQLLVTELDARDRTGLSGVALARFEAQYARDAMPPAPPPSETRTPRGPSHFQDPLFSEEAA